MPGPARAPARFSNFKHFFASNRHRHGFKDLPASQFSRNFPDDVDVERLELMQKGRQTMPFDGANYEVISPITQMLIEGKDRVQSGWCQQTMRQRGSVCMIGSLMISDFDVFVQAETLLQNAISQLGYSQRTVRDFNDDRSRTQVQVLEVYDKAIELSRLAV